KHSLPGVAGLVGPAVMAEVPHRMGACRCTVFVPFVAAVAPQLLPIDVFSDFIRSDHRSEATRSADGVPDSRRAGFLAKSTLRASCCHRTRYLFAICPFHSP